MRFKGKAVGQGKSTVVMALAGIVAACGGGGSGGSSTPENIALAGTIDIEAGTRVDSDSADVLWLNDTPLDSPQRLPPEFLLAGYVSQAGGNYPALSGLPATEYFADPFDEFSMSLQSGQTVYLQAFGTRAGSSQLELALLDGSTVLASDTTATTGQIRVAVPDTSADGTYQIKVSAIGDTPMLYVMSTSASGTTSGLSFSWPDYPFREGEAIVALADTGPGASAAALDGLSVADSRRELAPGLWHLRMNRSFAREHASENATLQWIEQLRSSPGVVSVTPNYEMKALSPVSEPLYNDPTLGQQWHYSLINAPTAWQVVGNGGIGQRVAVMDTGLFASGSGWHSEIVGNLPSPLPGGLDFVDDDNIPQDPGDELGSSVYHGTHVAGTVAAAVNGSGGAGVAYESTLLPVRVLGEGGTGSSVDLLEALQWVAGPSGGERRADIVNLSLGGLPEISSMQSAINTATAKGVIFVAAAGNSATSEKSYPAAFDNVFSVSAVDGAGRLASYSNFGSWIDLAAPGGDASRDGNADGRGDLVSSTSASFIDGSLKESYIGLQGTSMAAPHVSGVFALMKSVNPALDYSAIDSFLRSGQLTECGESGCVKTDALGWGLLDAGKAVMAASDGTIPALLVASPAIVSLSSEGELQQTVTVSMLSSSSGTAMINAVSEQADWLSVSGIPDASATVSSFELTMTLDPDALDSGISERETVTVSYTTDEARTLDIPVVGQTVSDQQARNAGRHFVLLVNPEPVGGFYEAVAQTSATASNGRYSFAFVPDDGEEPRQLNEVSPGNYILVAGTDLDNDGLICHAGEACAEYPVAGLRQEITITRGEPLTGINMTTSYTRPTISASSPDQLPRPDFTGYRLMSADQESRKAIATP